MKICALKEHIEKENTTNRMSNMENESPTKCLPFKDINQHEVDT